MSVIQGVYAAAVTPRRLGCQDINLGAMWDLVDYLISQGAQGLVFLGSTGEFVHFSNSERMRLMGVAVKRSRVPVIFNCSHSTSDGAVELAQSADASGAAAILLSPPYFFSYTQAQVIDFYRYVVREAELETPVVLYNIPQFTTGLSLDTVRVLVHEGVAQCVKDSSGDLNYFNSLLDLRRESPFSLMLGNDSLTTSVRSDGIISGVACAVPELTLALDRAVGNHVTEVVTRLEARLRQFIEWSDRLPVPVAIKEATAIRGLKVGPHALPNDGAFAHSLEAFREWFRGWLPGVQSECKHV